MGIVYRARDIALARTVAIKRLREEVLSSKRELEFFMSEARMVASLKHPNLVEIYSIIKHDGELYLVFEYVDGWTMQRLLDEKGRLSLEHALLGLRQIAAAVDYAHSRKVIHRDLKPSNVMVTREGILKVMDFGIAYQAKMTMAKLSRQEAWGTPPYMASEQELGDISRESDIYAMGVCFYEMLTGKVPFDGPNFTAQKQQMKLNPPSKLVAGLPPAIDAVILRVLDAAPAKRYHSCDELARAAEAASRA